MNAHVSLVGNLTRDAELILDGTPRLRFTIAVDGPKPRDGRDPEPASFWDVTLWHDDAVTYSERLTKGARVSVVGRPRIRDYDRADGSKGRAAEVEWPTVGILPARERDAVPSVDAGDPWAGGGQGAGW